MRRRVISTCFEMGYASFSTTRQVFVTDGGGCVVWSRRRERGYRSMKVGRHVAYPTNRAAGRRRGASAGADRAMSRHSSVTARDVRHGGFRCRVKSARTSPWSG
ncbi:hypothetical protein DM49_3636 [Burkholderia mallei]|nr:hypothetical protein DM49_3636 [Burkholderia mallei]